MAGEAHRVSWRAAAGVHLGAGSGLLLGVVPDKDHRACLVVARDDGVVVCVPYHEAAVAVPAKKRQYNHEKEST